MPVPRPLECLDVVRAKALHVGNVSRGRSDILTEDDHVLALGRGAHDARLIELAAVGFLFAVVGILGHDVDAKVGCTITVLVRTGHDAPALEGLHAAGRMG